jgi:uncharacterized protein
MPSAFIDTNVHMYAFGAPSAFRGPCQEILAVAVVHPEAFFIDAEVLQEISHRYTSLGRRDEAHRNVRDFARVMAHHIEPVYSFDVERSTELGLLNHRLSARDLVHLAVMERLGCTQIVSADQGFDAVSDMRRLHPRDFALWRTELGI